MRVALTYDEQLDTVALEFECDSSEAAEKLFASLTRQVEHGRVTFDLFNPDGSPPALETVQ